jgi:hypothetical protein
MIADLRTMRRRVLLAMLVLAAFFFGAAGSADAANISLTATLTGTTINVQVTGTADDCTADYCTAQSVVTWAEQVTSATDATDIAPVDCAASEEYLGESVTQGPGASVPVTGGTFSASGSINVSAGSVYVVCAQLDTTAFTVTTADESTYQTITTAPGVCPSNAAGALQLSAPSAMAVGRKAQVTATDDSISSAYSDITLTVQEAGMSIYSGPVSTSGSSRTVTLTASRSQPITATLTFTDNEQALSAGYLLCYGSVSKVIDVTTGQPPNVTFSYDSATSSDIAFSGTKQCSDTSHAQASITLSGNGFTARLFSADACAGTWRYTNKLPGVGFYDSNTGSGQQIEFTPQGSNDTYRVITKLNGRVVQRLWLQAIYFHTKAKKIWEGTDAFVNYCINGGHTTWSQNLKLYCIQPASTDEGAYLSRKKSG